MLSSIFLKNFKCFDDLHLPLSHLTILSGVNGMGKSTIIQSLLLIRQSYKASQLQQGQLTLQGDLVDLGTGTDVFFEYATDDLLTMGLESIETTTPFELKYLYESKSGTLTDYPDFGYHFDKDWLRVPPFSDNFAYIGAERIGARTVYPLSESNALRHEFGARSEYSLNFFKATEYVSLPGHDPRSSSASSQTKSAILNYWLNHITPGVNLSVQSIREADSLLPQFDFAQPHDVRSRGYRATNVGFGLSYVLPVLIALLSVQGTLCLIENPEAHIHPRGQTKLGELTALACAAGLQIVVETHSDHFLDGIRIAVRNGILESSNVGIHFFRRFEGSSKVDSPKIDDDGRISYWPQGFFDETEMNIARLLSPET